MADGGVVVPWPDASFTEITSVADDATNGRLFVADSNGSTVRQLRIFPVGP